MSTNESLIKKDDIVGVIKMIYDPEIPVDIWELGLIYDINFFNETEVSVKMTLTSPNCPAADLLPSQIKSRIKQLPNITDVDVEIVWEPPWNPQMMSEVAKLKLGYM